MAVYSRKFPEQSRAADKVYGLLSTHQDGATYLDLMRDHQDQISSHVSVLAAIELLREEGKVYSFEPWLGRGFLENVRLYANPLGA